MAVICYRSWKLLSASVRINVITVILVPSVRAFSHKRGRNNTLHNSLVGEMKCITIDSFKEVIQHPQQMQGMESYVVRGRNKLMVVQTLLILQK